MGKGTMVRGREGTMQTGQVAKMSRRKRGQATVIGQGPCPLVLSDLFLLPTLEASRGCAKMNPGKISPSTSPMAIVNVGKLERKCCVRWPFGLDGFGTRLSFFPLSFLLSFSKLLHLFRVLSLLLDQGIIAASQSK